MSTLPSSLFIVRWKCQFIACFDAPAQETPSGPPSSCDDSFDQKQQRQKPFQVSRVVTWRRQTEDDCSRQALNASPATGMKPNNSPLRRLILPGAANAWATVGLWSRVTQEAAILRRSPPFLQSLQTSLGAVDFFLADVILDLTVIGVLLWISVCQNSRFIFLPTAKSLLSSQMVPSWY